MKYGMTASEDKSLPSFKIGCMPWEGALLSIAIIAIRALRPEAQPIESWSISSWCLMLLPAFFPILIWTALLVLWVIGTIVSVAFTKQ